MSTEDNTPDQRTPEERLGEKLTDGFIKFINRLGMNPKSFATGILRNRNNPGNLEETAFLLARGSSSESEVNILLKIANNIVNNH